MARCSLQALLIAFVSYAAAPCARADSFDSDGVTIHYTVDGDAGAEPVILVHGYTADGKTNWRLPGVVDLLDDDYRVITLDNRGHGESDKPLDESAYGQNMVDDVVRLLDHLQIERAHVVGYSMGGMIAMKLVAAHPERVRSAVVGGMGWVDADRLPFDGTSGRREGAADTPLAACRRAFPKLAITQAELEAIKTPMTVVIGADDRLSTRVDAMNKVRDDIPVVVVPEANHISCIFKPQFKAAIKEFLDAQPQAQAE